MRDKQKKSCKHDFGEPVEDERWIRATCKKCGDGIAIAKFFLHI